MKAAICVCAVLGAANSALGNVTYDSEGAFLAAATGPLVSETFESAPLVGTPNVADGVANISFDHFDAFGEGESPPLKVLDVPRSGT